MSSNSQQSKTRHLSIYEFFEVLQLEYLTAELRRKIYSKQKDREYYTKVMEWKRRKINDIAVRNSLPSLFTDDTTKQTLYQKLYNEKGLPNFVYRDDKDREQFSQQDVEAYYSVGATVKIHNADEIIIGEIYEVNFEKGVIFIKPKGQEECRPHSIENVTRIV